VGTKRFEAILGFAFPRRPSLHFSLRGTCLGIIYADSHVMPGKLDKSSYSNETDLPRR
jgi:hypothetical protein